MNVIVFFHEDFAFLKLKGGQALCLGTREEVNTADEQKLAEVIRLSSAINHFNGITSQGAIKH